MKLHDLHDDRLGTPQLATDSSQNIAWQASYDPLGWTNSVTGTITQNLRLPGQYFDVESGWNHNGFRDYLPALGRYGGWPTHEFSTECGCPILRAFSARRVG